ncbi:hypothetical protein F66182_7716, partial [Fusarium sp. NRRL 66182]
MPANSTDRFARRRPPAPQNASLPPHPDGQRERRRPSDSLLNDPTSDLLIDFNSQEGFYAAAKKKKTKAPSGPPPPTPPP